MIFILRGPAIKRRGQLFMEFGFCRRMERQQVPGPNERLRCGLVASHKDRDHFIADFFGRHSAASLGVTGSYQSRQEIFCLAVWYTARLLIN